MAARANAREMARASKRRDVADQGIVDLDKLLVKANKRLAEAQGDVDRLQGLKDQALERLDKAVSELEAMRVVEVRADV